jgi:hypothetical protein
MKNIHLLPTEKPSRLTKPGGSSSIKLYTNGLTNTPKGHCKNYHLYITSDSEVKEGDWGLSKLNEVILFGRRYNEKLYKKIILTTDQDLIADGVQAIDDEFLEWFVKNTSCEMVEIDRDEKEVGNHLGGVVTEYGDYKIIIPQEEPKQETLTYTEAAKKEERIFNSTMMSKQETLEEAAEKYCSNNHAINEDRAAWQDIEFAFNDGAKWQQERMYSETEVLQLLLRLQQTESYDNLYDWFEQFKKKIINL